MNRNEVVEKSALRRDFHEEVDHLAALGVYVVARTVRRTVHKLQASLVERLFKSLPACVLVLEPALACCIPRLGTLRVSKRRQLPVLLVPKRPPVVVRRGAESREIRFVLDEGNLLRNGVREGL